MEEIEVPTEEVREHLQHQAQHGGAVDPWIGRVALSSAIIAALAAVAALRAGHDANEAMIEQLRASDHWSYYQAKGIKAAVLSTKITLLEAQGKKASETDTKKLEGYSNDQKELQDKAKEEEESSRKHLDRHVTQATAVTLFQIAIAIGAISALTRRRMFWYVSLCFGGVGLLFLVISFLK